MEPITLSLRQRKLLNLIQNQSHYITGQALAKQLNVSPRTIRSDIVEINTVLASDHARISAERSKGYFFECDDITSFHKIYPPEDLLLTREDRIRYLTFQLCLSDIPLNQYDLEDEMYVSRTTLENDISTLKSQYVLSAPYIKIFHNTDTWEFEKDEQKRRFLLNQLFRHDWDYNNAGNAYYSYHFIDEKIMNLIMQITARLLLNAYFQIEDSNLVTLNLALAIMYYRLLSGHTLPASDSICRKDKEANSLCEEIFVTLEEIFLCSFPIQEKDAIYLHLERSHLLDATKLNFQTVSDYFDSDIIQMCDQYLLLIDSTFDIDFSVDEDFYITLLQYLRYLKTPDHVLNAQGNSNLLHRNLIIESEFAFLFQDVFVKYTGHYLNETELLYLALCFSGALESYWEHHPEKRIKTVICCHLNLTATWAIKRKLLAAFGNYLTVTDLMPVNAKSAFNFSDTNLVLTTVKKEITNNPGTRVLQISPDMSPSDYSVIQQFLSDNSLNFLFEGQKKSLASLLTNGYWHENLTLTSRFHIIEYLAQDFINNHLVSPQFLESLLRREATYTYGFQPGALVLYSLVPSKETKLSIATFKHRILWGNNKIRVIVMAAFAPGEESLLLKLLQEIYVDHNNMEYFRKEHSKTELLDFFSSKHTPSDKSAPYKSGA